MFESVMVISVLGKADLNADADTLRSACALLTKIHVSEAFKFERTPKLTEQFELCAAWK